MKARTFQAAGSTAEMTAFYERYVEEHVPYQRSPGGVKGLVLRYLPYWSWREWRFWRRYVPAGGLLLDLGCARGREIFTERASTCVGIDLARNALGECAEHYRLAVQGTLGALPFRDECFDCVVTSHVLGHVPAAEKDHLLAELARVLKKGGRTLHVIETDSRHPLVRFAKQEPDLFERHFIEPDGHVGLETGSAVLERFARHGLRCRRFFQMDAGVFHPRLFLKFFDNEYRRRSRSIDRRARLGHWVMKHAAALATTEVLLGLHHFTVGQWLYPLDRCQFLGLVCEKDGD